jgi:hypothetical protein
MIPTADPFVFIEEQYPGYVRYRNLDGRRWEVHGMCDRRGDCLIGMRIPGYGIIYDHSDIEEAKKTLGKDRIDSDMDVPVTPEFDSCCGSPDGPFRIVEVEPYE